MNPCPVADTNVCRSALFMCNNDNQTATQKTPKNEKRRNQKLFANVRIFCPTKRKTYKNDSKRKITFKNKIIQFYQT